MEFSLSYSASSHIWREASEGQPLHAHIYNIYIYILGHIDLHVQPIKKKPFEAFKDTGDKKDPAPPKLKKKATFKRVRKGRGQRTRAVLKKKKTKVLAQEKKKSTTDELLPVPDDMPTDAHPNPKAPRGKLSYTVRDTSLALRYLRTLIHRTRSNVAVRQGNGHCRPCSSYIMFLHVGSQNVKLFGITFWKLHFWQHAWYIGLTCISLHIAAFLVSRATMNIYTYYRYIYINISYIYIHIYMYTIKLPWSWLHKVRHLQQR